MLFDPCPPPISDPLPKVYDHLSLSLMLVSSTVSVTFLHFAFPVRRRKRDESNANSGSRLGSFRGGDEELGRNYDVELNLVALQVACTLCFFMVLTAPGQPSMLPASFPRFRLSSHPPTFRMQMQQKEKQKVNTDVKIVLTSGFCRSLKLRKIASIDARV